jgi:hypothetical protein
VDRGWFRIVWDLLVVPVYEDVSGGGEDVRCAAVEAAGGEREHGEKLEVVDIS